MFDYKPTLVAALETILPTYYEYSQMSDVTPPCITYYESSDSSSKEGDTLRYSYKIFTIKVWGGSVDVIAPYTVAVDAKMKELGFKRLSYNELAYDNGISGIFTYEGLGKE